MGECLRGAPPFVGGSAANVLLKIMTERPPPVDTEDANVPPAIARAIERALERDQRQRHGSIRAFADALREGARAAGLIAPDHGRPSTLTPLSLSPPALAPPTAGAATPEAISIALDSHELRGRAPRGLESAKTAVASPRSLGNMATVAAPARASGAEARPADIAAPTPPSRRRFAAAGITALLLLSLVGVYGILARSADPPTARAPTAVAPGAALVASPPSSAVATPFTPPREIGPTLDAPLVAPEAPTPEVPASPVSHAGRPRGVPEPRRTAPSSRETAPVATPPAEAPETPASPHHGLPGVVEW